MCFRLKHFPAHHNDRTSLTPAVISSFKVHEMRQRPGLRPGPRWGSLQRSPDPLAGLGEGKGIRREGNWERKEGKGNGREGRGEREAKERRGGERGRGEREGEGPDQVSREIDAPEHNNSKAVAMQSAKFHNRNPLLVSNSDVVLKTQWLKDIENKRKLSCVFGISWGISEWGISVWSKLTVNGKLRHFTNEFSVLLLFVAAFCLLLNPWQHSL